MVKAGETLGLMGSTGNSNGAHLHLEFERGTVWRYAKGLIDPNELVDWNEFGKEKEDTGIKEWKNGSSKEPVYGTTADCKAKKNAVGSLAPWEKAGCFGVSDGCYLVEYKVTGGRKCGYVAYPGGVK
jgi:hypothetical protein